MNEASEHSLHAHPQVAQRGPIRHVAIALAALHAYSRAPAVPGAASS